MQWPTDAIDQFETIVTQLAGETHLAQPDSDEGLLPILSLVNELTTELPEDPAIAAIAATIEATLNPLLEEAKRFDAPGIQTLRNAANDLSNHLLALKTSEEPKDEKKTHTKKKRTRATKIDILDSLDELPSFDTPEEPDPASFESELPVETPLSALEPAPTPEPSANPSESTLLGEDRLARFDTLSQQLSGELLLAEKGSDDGLLPLYSLLSELSSEFNDIEILGASIHPVFSQV